MKGRKKQGIQKRKVRITKYGNLSCLLGPDDQNSTFGWKALSGWIAGLSVMVAIGVVVYIQQLNEGLIVTHMTNEVCWGLGIANFVYFVGVAAAAVILVFPSYVYHNKELKEVVLIGELLAVVAITMCLLFRISQISEDPIALHLMPGIGGILNIPTSLLAWDVLVFNGYFTESSCSRVSSLQNV